MKIIDAYPALNRAVDDPDHDVGDDDVMVLRHASPKGDGMPVWGILPIPTKLQQAGVKDMLRPSDARMKPMRQVRRLRA